MSVILKRSLKSFLKLERQSSSILKNIRRNNTDGEFVKTTITRLNAEEGVDLQITGLDEHGFYINEKMYVMGPCVLFSKAIFSWNISGIEEVNKDSLSLFTILEPKLDVLIIGTGNSKSRIDFEVPKWLIKNKLTNFEILPTEKAINAFNFLVAENRHVGAALIPTTVKDNKNEDIIKMLEKKGLYDDDDDEDIKLELGAEKRMKNVIAKVKELEKKNKIESGEDKSKNK